jgi:alpha-L-arabinofuranosidase
LSTGIVARRAPTGSEIPFGIRVVDLGNDKNGKPQTTGALPIKKYAAEYNVHPCTVWRAIRDCRLEYVVIGKRKLMLPPVVQRADVAE